MLLERYLESMGSEAIRDALGLKEGRPALVRPTQDPKFGDFQLNGAMPLGKELGKPPRELAQPVAARLSTLDAVEKAEVAGPGFINLHLSTRWIASKLTDALRDPERDGVPEVEPASKIIVDFSSPNIAKQMHVGHLRSTIIGDAIARLLEFLGHDVIRDNHLGDWGTQFGLLIVGMREWGDEGALQSDPIRELERVYKLASERAANEDAFAERARAELAKLQSGDEENLALWKHFVEVSRKALDEVYAELGVSFDVWLGESAYHDALPGVVEELLSRGIARKDEGAVCIFWDEVDAPKALRKQKTPFIVQKKDGAFLYSTTDIATVLHRRDRFGADRALYVVDNRQALHFQQLFAVMKLLGVEMELEHVGFGTVLGPDGKPLRTRDASGQVITLVSLLDEAKERARQRIEEGIAEGRLRVRPDEMDQVCRVVGIGAVKYADLRQNRLSDYQFDWDKMISFQGNAGPYLQYAYARCASIFAKGGLVMEEVADTADISLDAAAEIGLGKHLLRFGDVVYQAAATSQPHLVCEHIYELARAFNGFYAECPVLDAEGPTRQSRLGLTALTARQIRRGLGLVGIGVVDRM